MLEEKLFRYKEFSIPFMVYREGELSREDFLVLIGELREILQGQHEELRASLERDEDLRENHRKLHDSLIEASILFEEALDIAENALEGPEEEEEDTLDEALETFHKGNLLLADSYYELDEMWERSDVQGSL